MAPYERARQAREAGGWSGGGLICLVPAVIGIQITRFPLSAHCLKSNISNCGEEGENNRAYSKPCGKLWEFGSWHEKPQCWGSVHMETWADLYRRHKASTAARIQMLYPDISSSDKNLYYTLATDTHSCYCNPPFPLLSLCPATPPTASCLTV